MNAARISLAAALVAACSGSSGPPLVDAPLVDASAPPAIDSSAMAPPQDATRDVGIENEASSPMDAWIAEESTDALADVDAAPLIDATEASVDACIPATCASKHYACGDVMDGCGSILSCGSCTAPSQCARNTMGWFSCVTVDAGACILGYASCATPADCDGCLDPYGVEQSSSCSGGTCCSNGPVHCGAILGAACGLVPITQGCPGAACGCDAPFVCSPSGQCSIWWQQCAPIVASTNVPTGAACYFSNESAQWYACAGAPNIQSGCGANVAPSTPAPSQCAIGHAQLVCN